MRDRAVTIRTATGDDVTLIVCPKCHKRGMAERKGPYGSFLGCAGYPLCDGKAKIDSAWFFNGVRGASVGGCL